MISGKKRNSPKIEAIKEEEGATAAEKKRADSLEYVHGRAGLLTGEAFFGTESSILSFIDTLVADPNSTGWYIGRMAGFIGLNVEIGWIIYALFKRAGVIGAPKYWMLSWSTSRDQNAKWIGSSACLVGPWCGHLWRIECRCNLHAC